MYTRVCTHMYAHVYAHVYACVYAKLGDTHAHTHTHAHLRQEAKLGEHIAEGGGAVGVCQDGVVGGCRPKEYLHVYVQRMYVRVSMLLIYFA